jgi:soluble lytic murein transglycosylase-like protein
MRLLIMALAILSGSLLLIQPTDILAASVDSETYKNNTLRQIATSSGKEKDPRLFSVKQKSLHNPGDVWVRIRSTMQIPRPTSVQALPDINNNLSAPSSEPRINPEATLKIPASQRIRQPITAVAPLHNYTPYGRLKFNSAIASRIRKPVALAESSTEANNRDPQEMAVAYKRLHTRIEPHPTLDLSLPTEFPVSRLLPLEKSVNTDHLGHAAITADVSGRGLTPPMPHHAKAAIKYDRVNKHIVWYAQHSSYLHQVAERARPYLYHIVENLSKHQLPSELALLPIVESAYQPTALSPKSAAGLWQFIPSTGHDFDLHQTDHYDARLDIAASTQAAVRYLSFLKQHFNGDWLLALAAYNCGLGLVDNAIERNVAEGLDTDYWSLRLPEETQEYVPRFLALSSIFANPEAHGLKLTPVRNEPYFVKVQVDREHEMAYLAEKDFKEVARLADLTYEQFSRLNPGYLNPKLAAKGPFTFFLPTANANQLHQNLASIAQFLNKPKAMAASATHLTRSPLPTIDEQKTALSLSNGIGLVTATNPFLSLNPDTRQTSPRMTN